MGTQESAQALIGQDVLRSSGNVFADMGLPDAVEFDTKAGSRAEPHHGKGPVHSG